MYRTLAEYILEDAGSQLGSASTAIMRLIR
jgi:hypothetical protein